MNTHICDIKTIYRRYKKFHLSQYCHVNRLFFIILLSPGLSTYSNVMLGRSKLSGKKTRQRRGSDCRGGRDAVGGAAKCRGCRSIWRQGRVWQGKKGKFRKIGWNGHQVRAILSRFGDLEPPSLSGKSPSCPYIRP